MNKSYLKAGSFFAALAIMLGAFGTHYIGSRVNLSVLNIFETAIRYQMYHALGLILVGIVAKEFTSKHINWAAKLFIIGIIVFSGSLYLLTYFKAVEAKQFYWLGAVTPIGGVAFIVGWCLLLCSFFKK